MTIRLKRRHLIALFATILYLLVGFFIDEEGFGWWVAIGLFWLIVAMLEDGTRSGRKPDVPNAR